MEEHRRETYITSASSAAMVMAAVEAAVVRSLGSRAAGNSDREQKPRSGALALSRGGSRAALGALPWCVCRKPEAGRSPAKHRGLLYTQHLEMAYTGCYTCCTLYSRETARAIRYCHIGMRVFHDLIMNYDSGILTSTPRRP